MKKFKYSNAKPNGFFDIQNPTGFWIQIGTLFCGKVSAACQLPPPLISKWIYSLGPEIFELLCFRPLAPSVFGFFSFHVVVFNFLFDKRVNPNKKDEMEGLIFALACYKKINSSIVDIFIEEKAVILVIVSKGTSFD
mgnify:CR=1 FL=1